MMIGDTIAHRQALVYGENRRMAIAHTACPECEGKGTVLVSDVWGDEDWDVCPACEGRGAITLRLFARVPGGSERLNGEPDLVSHRREPSRANEATDRPTTDVTRVERVRR
jgi:hypothetical protein